HCLAATAAECVREIAKAALLPPQCILPNQAVALLTFKKRAVVQFGLRVHALIAGLVARPPHLSRHATDLFEPRSLARQILRLSPQLTDPLLVSGALNVDPLKVRL